METWLRDTYKYDWGEAGVPFQKPKAGPEIGDNDENWDSYVQWLTNRNLYLPFDMEVKASHMAPPGSFYAPLEKNPSAGTADGSEHRPSTVSYTHLTLPTTPYV